MAATAAPTTRRTPCGGDRNRLPVYIGAGSAAATGVIAAGTKVPFSMAQLGMISFAFMFAVIGVVYAIGHISGGHINPAVTLGLAVSGKFPWRDVPGYVAAQVVGALIGALGYFVTLGKAQAVAAGGGVTSYNPATMGFGRGTLIEAIGTAILVFVVFGVIDHRAVPGWAPTAIGSAVFAIIIILGPATGAAINPARYVGAMVWQSAFGGSVHWSQGTCLPHRENSRAAYSADSPTWPCRAPATNAALTSLAPTDPDDAPVSSPAPASRKAHHEEAHQQPGQPWWPMRWPGWPPRIRHSPWTSRTRSSRGPAGRRRARSAWCPAAEPATSRCTGGFVGYGCLDAACPGEVFTSPVPDQMLAATKAVNGGAGVCTS